MSDPANPDLRLLSFQRVRTADPVFRERIVATAREWLTDRSEDANDDRLVAYTTLLRLGDFDAAADGLWDPSVAVVIDVCRMLADRRNGLSGDAQAKIAARLGYLTGNPYGRLAAAALHAIGWLRLTECTDEVLDALDDATPQVAGAALGTAADLGLDVITEAREALVSGEPDLIRGGLRVAAATADPVFTDPIIETVLPFFIRANAKTATRIIGPLESALGAYDPPLAVAAQLAPMLGWAGQRTHAAKLLRFAAPDPAAVGPLRRLTGDPSDKLRGYVHDALAVHDPEGTRESVQMLLADPDEANRLRGWRQITDAPALAPAGAAEMAVAAAANGTTLERAAALRAAVGLTDDRSIAAAYLGDANEKVALVATELAGDLPAPDPVQRDTAGDLFARFVAADPTLDEEGRTRLVALYREVRMR